MRVVTWKPREERMPGRRKFSKLSERNSLAEIMRKRHFKVPAHLGFLNRAEHIWWGWGGEVGKDNSGAVSVERSILLLTSFRIAGAW